MRDIFVILSIGCVVLYGIQITIDINESEQMASAVYCLPPYIEVFWDACKIL